MILVTGATGHLGKATVEHLLKNTEAKNILAFARDESKTGYLKEKGIEVRIGNLDDAASIEKALKGVDKLFLISTADQHRFEQHKNAVDAAKNAGVKHIVYTSISIRDIKTSAIAGIMNSHFETEDYIKASGLNYTILRNGQYMEVIPMFAGENVFETGIYLPAGNGESSFVLRREMGEAAANVLLQPGHENKTYDITGSVLYSYADVAKELSALSGKQVIYTDADLDEYSVKMKQFGVPEMYIYMIAGFATDNKNNQFSALSNDLENLLGRKPATLKEGLKEIYNL